MREKILLIDDDRSLAELLVLKLEQKGFDVLVATQGKDGLRLAYDNHPDLVILDVMMPELDGYEICRRLREMSDVPILMLTGKYSEEEVVRGFQAGADDYVKKPFNLRELESRIRAILKRSGVQPEETNLVYDDGLLHIDLERHKVMRNGMLVHLTSTEFQLLSCLVKRQGVLVPHEEILGEVWGPTYLESTACLSLYIRYLREKLEKNPGEPEYIRTKWGVGYWFSPSQK